MRFRAIILVIATLSGVYAFGDPLDSFRSVERRTKYETRPEQGNRVEVDVIRRILDHAMNSTALLRYASIEVAELRGVRLAGGYRLEPSAGEDAFSASVFASDPETDRFASSLVSGAGSEVVTIRVVSWGLTEAEHRQRAGELITQFKAQEESNQPVETTPVSAPH